MIYQIIMWSIVAILGFSVFFIARHLGKRSWFDNPLIISYIVSATGEGGIVASSAEPGSVFTGSGDLFLTFKEYLQYIYSRELV